MHNQNILASNKFSNGPHREQWSVWTCSILKRHIFLGVRQLAEKHEGGSDKTMMCYRCLLCEKEHQDCWFVKPESDIIPFDYDSALEAIQDSGKLFPCGMDPLVLIENNNIKEQEKITILREFILNQIELNGSANFEIKPIKDKLETYCTGPRTSVQLK